MPEYKSALVLFAWNCYLHEIWMIDMSLMNSDLNLLPELLQLCLRHSLLFRLGGRSLKRGHGLSYGNVIGRLLGHLTGWCCDLWTGRSIGPTAYSLPLSSGQLLRTLCRKLNSYYNTITFLINLILLPSAELLEVAPPTLGIEAPPTLEAPPTMAKPLGPLLAAAVHVCEGGRLTVGWGVPPNELPALVIIIVAGEVAAMGPEMEAGELLVRGDGLVDSVSGELRHPWWLKWLTVIFTKLCSNYGEGRHRISAGRIASTLPLIISRYTTLNQAQK